MPKYNEKEIKNAIKNSPNWMNSNIIAANGKVCGKYKFESKQINLMSYNDSLRRKLFDFEAYYLRDSVWSLQMKMGLIYSICHEIHLPSFWLAEHPDDASKCDIIDSKNRSVAIYEFFNGDFPIPIQFEGEEKIHLFYWEDIEKCTPPEPKSKKKLNELQKKLCSLNQVIRNTTIPVNRVYGCDVRKRAELSALLSRHYSWTSEEMLFNFNWHCKSLFKFLFKFCIADTGLYLSIRSKDASINHRDKGSIFIGKIMWLLYGNLFKDTYADRHLGNNIGSAKQDKDKSKFVQYIEELDEKLSHSEKQIKTPSDCQDFFEKINVEFKKIDSLKKTCKIISDIINTHGIIKKLDTNDILDIIVHIERKINERIITHSMMKFNRETFHELIKNYRDKKNEMGAIATAQSSTINSIRIRRELFEKCLIESEIDLNLKNKKIPEKMKQKAIWESNGIDPVTNKKIIEPQVNHGNPKSLSGNPGKVEVMDAQTNRLMSNITPDISEKISEYQKNFNF